MRKSVLAILSVTTLILVIAGCTDPAPSQPGPVPTLTSEVVVAPTQRSASQQKIGTREGNLAPDFMLRNLFGEEVLLSDLRGNVIFLNFWATWCIYCKTEMASMERMYQEYKNQGLLVVAVDVGGRGETIEKIEKFIEDSELTFLILVDLRGKTKGAFKVNALPSTYILDRNGVIQKIVIGGRDWDDKNNRQLILDVLEQDDE